MRKEFDLTLKNLKNNKAYIIDIIDGLQAVWKYVGQKILEHLFKL